MTGACGTMPSKSSHRERNRSDWPSACYENPNPLSAYLVASNAPSPCEPAPQREAGKEDRQAESEDDHKRDPRVSCGQRG
jgi:hypothetical protein